MNGRMLKMSETKLSLYLRCTGKRESVIKHYQIVTFEDASFNKSLSEIKQSERLSEIPMFCDRAKKFEIGSSYLFVMEEYCSAESERKMNAILKALHETIFTEKQLSDMYDYITLKASENEIVTDTIPQQISPCMYADPLKTLARNE
jgi:hypothetical protein